MDRDQWSKHYGRLCTSFNKPLNAEQASAYFDALHAFPDLCIQQAIVRAVRQSKHWPHAADLVEFAREERGKLSAPKSACTRCQGLPWVDGPPIAEPWGTFPSVMRCPVCWPGARRGAA